MSEVAKRIEANLAAVRERIAGAARRAGRDPRGVTLVAVTKTVGTAEMAALSELGVADFGENRVDVTRAKQAELGTLPARWHMIGSIQRRKAREVAELFDWVHSIDRVEVGETLDRHAGERGKLLDAFVEVNVSGEPSKHGFAPADLGAALDRLRALAHVRIRGLMTMAPFVADPELARPVFAALRELGERFECRELSMGMSNDYEVAVEEGATAVRIGTALY